MLVCPVCQKLLSVEEKRAVCPQGHSFDRAKEGYFNLLLSSSAGGHGDDKAMLLARRAFLEKGYYAPLRDAVQSVRESYFSPEASLADAGCGEGYYTSALAGGEKGRLFAFDISKDAARLTAKALSDRALVFVGSAYRMPLASASLDGVFSLFSPLALEEFDRVIRPGGYLIRVCPLPEHLYALKEAVYENPRICYDVPEMPSCWHLCQTEEIRRKIFLPSKEDIRALFGMTPYAHKTGREDISKLEALSSLTVETAFSILVYRKEA